MAPMVKIKQCFKPS